jgi:hypothetical protein
VTAVYGTDTLPDVEIRVDRHYEGPPGATNGGWACGLVAGLLTGPDTSPGTAVEVTLRAPVPLETPIRGERQGDSAFLTGPPDGNGTGRLLAEARLLDDDGTAVLPPPPAFVPLADARRAGAPDACVPTPFPSCYVCGTDRPGGLRVRVGPTSADGPIAGVWSPPPTLGALQPRYVWAALDCPTGLVHVTDNGAKALLGRLTLTARRTPVPGEPLVIVAAATGADRRKRFSTGALYTAAGNLVAKCAATWITI